jgi:CheY-like chemotaxis protein
VAGETILIVEDSDMVRRMYEDLLVAAGYRVLGAGDGLECLNVMAREKVDLVLLDLVMPRLGGLEALAAIRHDPRTASVPVIILSNLEQDEDVRHGLELGATDYILKSTTTTDYVTSKIRARLTV